MVVTYDFMILDSLQKVFPEEKPMPLQEEEKHFYLFGGERLSFQLAYTMEYDGALLNEQEISLVAECEAAEQLNMRLVKLVPAGLAAFPNQVDDNYLFTVPGLCPDLLLPAMRGMVLRPLPSQWQAMWFDLTVTVEMQGKTIPLTLYIKKNQDVLWKDTIWLHVQERMLSAQSLIHTEWFHADCLADYYHVPVFSEEHWRIIGNFMDTAVKNGVNMLLTPIFTPPLDTEEGGERTTVQLVDVEKHADGSYGFEFSKLRRWIRMCLEKGIRYIEISHLFSQWGAKYAPKIVGAEHGEKKRLFGWDTPAVGGAYTEFLYEFLPQLKQVLKEEGVFENTYFHISDEPDESQKEAYAAAKRSIEPLLSDCVVIDALSSYEMYQEGIVEHPIPCNDHIQAFLDAGVKDLFTYYCCAQGYRVSNRFFAMPSARNRIIGVLFYLYEIKGFLHWGYNFYNAQFSKYTINPYLVTDADGAFPSGDAFAVYPAADGSAYESIRLVVFAEALQDMRALQALEEATDRDFVEKLIYEGVNQKITFAEYPKEPGYIRRLRRRIFEELQKLQP